MGTRLILSSLLLFFTMSVLAQKKKKGENPQLASGKKVYASLCIACHQEDGSGVPLSNTGYRPGITTDKGIWFVTGRGIIFYDYNRQEFYHQ